MSTSEIEERICQYLEKMAALRMVTEKIKAEWWKELKTFLDKHEKPGCKADLHNDKSDL